VIGAADEVIDSIDREELAKFFARKNDPEEEEAEVPNLVFNNSCYSIACVFLKWFLKNRR